MESLHLACPTLYSCGGGQSNFPTVPRPGFPSEVVAVRGGLNPVLRGPPKYHDILCYETPPKLQTPFLGEKGKEEEHSIVFTFLLSRDCKF